MRDMISPEITPPVCPGFSGVSCPVLPCPGATEPGICKHLASLAAWRSLDPDEQTARLSMPRPVINPAIRDAVNACPDRGSVLPISMQDDCGCRGRELSACKAGKGEVPGRVTLRDCLACKGLTSKRETPDTSGEWSTVEAPGGFEPPMEVLQTSALPLGYGARF
jgi:hypothetical protein